MAELERVISPGGTAFIIDNDLTGGTFSSWIRRIPGWKYDDPAAIDEFYCIHGFTIERIESERKFDRREDLDAVVQLEFL